MRTRLILVAGLLVVGAVACTGPSAAPKVDQAPVRASDKVVAEGSVQPIQTASLGFQGGGIVTEILAKEGDSVQSGQVIARVQSARQRAALLQAEAQLAASEAALAKAKAGPRDEEIRAAQAGLQAAEAGVTRTAADPQAIAGQQAAVAAQQAAVTSQQAAVRSAEAEYDRVAVGADASQLTTARTNMEKAARAVQQAQAVYDQVFWRTDIAASVEALNLERTTQDYIAARAVYDNLVSGPKSQDLAAAQARVDQAQSAVNQARAGVNQAQAGVNQAAAGGRAGERAAAAAEVARAQANLDLVQAGARAEDIAQAQANVRVAAAGVESARAALAETELKAPFTGRIAQLDLRLGEQINPGVPVARLADTSAFQVRTTDLTELSVVRVREGSPVILTFDALPGLELPGKVTRISGFGENRQGDINYTVWVTPDQADPRLRWNMTASVRIDAPPAP